MGLGPSHPWDVVRAAAGKWSNLQPLQAFGRAIESSETLWSFLSLLSFRQCAPTWRSGKKLCNLWIAMNFFYPFSCCVALSRLALLPCELYLNDQALLNAQSLNILLHLCRNSGNIISVAHFAIWAAKEIFTWIPFLSFRNCDQFVLLGPSQLLFPR